MDFERWLREAKPGDRRIYFVGYLPVAKWRWQVRRAARIAWEAYLDGKVHLVQSKVGPGQYEYIAVRRSRRIQGV